MMAEFQGIVIGASAGALEALGAILPVLPRGFRLPILIVVHLPPGPSSLVELFTHKCQVVVKEAEDKEPLIPGTVYFAPPNYHLLVEVDKTVSLSADEPVFFSRPSIDVLFETAAETFRESLIGIVLSGANSDGAEGLKAVIDAGGAGLIQDPSTAFAGAMPKAAAEKNPAAIIMTPRAIAEYLEKV